jgi:hypothetical protein
MTYPTSGTPNDAVWEPSDDDQIIAEQIELPETHSPLAEATEAFAHETAAESARVFEEIGETAAEAAATFKPSMMEKVVEAASPAIVTVIGKVTPVVANAAVSLAPVVAKAEAVAKPVIEKATELLEPALAKAEPFFDEAGKKFSEFADSAAKQADNAAHAFDVGFDRFKDTMNGLAEIAKPVAENLVDKVKTTVNEKINRK